MCRMNGYSCDSDITITEDDWEDVIEIIGHPTCSIFGCDYAPLMYMKKGEARQTDNGFLISRIKGWYCPICAGSYGDFQY